MQHDGTNTVFMKHLFVASVFMKPEATSTRLKNNLQDMRLIAQEKRSNLKE